MLKSSAIRIQMQEQNSTGRKPSSGNSNSRQEQLVQINNPLDSAAESLALQKENIALHTENIRLINELEHVSDRLKTAMSAIASSTLPQELANAQQQIAISKKQIASLKSWITENPESQMQDIQLILKGKDLEIDMLKREIAQLKHRSSIKQKNLMIVDQGDGKFKAQYERLLQEYDRLRRRCEESQKLLKKRNPIPRIVQVHANEHTRCIVKYQREIQALKNSEIRAHKTYRHLNWQFQKLKEQNEQLIERVRDKERQVFQSHGKLLRYKKQIKRGSNQGSKYHIGHLRSVTLPCEEQQQQLHSNRVHFKSTLLPSLYDKAVYPKLEYAGQSISNGKVWNDLALSSKIIAVRVSLNQDETIECIDCTYEKGVTERISEECEDCFEFICENNEFIQTISGQFSEQKLSFLELGTNNGRTARFGVYSTDSTAFEFKIGALEYPVSIFGEYFYIGAQKKINKFGCLIQKMN